MDLCGKETVQQTRKVLEQLINEGTSTGTVANSSRCTAHFAEAMKKPNINNLLSKFAAQEEDFMAREFIAAKLRGTDVNVRVGGAICRMRTHPRRYEGIGIFRPKSTSEAELVREATLTERSRYLNMLPRLKLIIECRRGTQWMGRMANRSDARFAIDGAVPIHMALDVQTFDVVVARFDCRQFWFDEVDMAQPPMTAISLRNALDAQVHPRDLEISDVTPELRDAYAVNYRRRYEPVAANAQAEPIEVEPMSADAVRNRLRDNLTHAGAELVDYAEHGDGFRVTYKVDGKQHISSLDKSDLTIQSAGFCLDDLDRDFDLASLVGVVREGYQTEQMYDYDH